MSRSRRDNDAHEAISPRPGNGIDGVDDQPPTQVAAFTDAFQIGIGDYHTCVLTNAGTVSCTGDNNSGEIGLDPGSSSRETSPVTVTGLSNIVDLASNDAHNCALDAAGTVRCWGNNSSGQLGNTTTTDNHVPQVVTLPGPAVDVAAGSNHSCAALATGAVWCWGSGTSGELGNGAATDSTSPVPVTGITTATAVALGDEHSCAVLADMTAVCWGDGRSSVLGNGDDLETDQPTPVAVTGLSGITHLSSRDDHTCARTSDGGASCWGSGSNGQLGLDILSSRPTAYQVSTLTPSDITDGSAKTIDGKFEAEGIRTAGQSTRLDVAGRGTIPVSATTVTINITAIGASGTGYVTVHACLPKPPNASSLNHVAGVNGGNEVVARLDADGDLCLFTSSPTNLTVDIAGYTT